MRVLGKDLLNGHVYKASTYAKLFKQGYELKLASEKLHIYVLYHTIFLVFNAQLWKHVNFLENNYA